MTIFQTSSWLGVLAVGLIGCGGADTPAAQNPCIGSPQAVQAESAPGEAQGAGAPVDISDWTGWDRVSAKRFLSKSHQGAWVDIYVQPQHAATYRAGVDHTAPVGMTVVKVQYAAEDDTGPQGFTVMSKMKPGYAPDAGDWWWAAYDADATTMKSAGKLDACASCHERADDYLYGRLE